MIKNPKNGEMFLTLTEIAAEECDKKTAFRDLTNAFGCRTATAFEWATQSFLTAYDNELTKTDSDCDLAAAYFGRRLMEERPMAIEDVRHLQELFNAYNAGLFKVIDLDKKI